MERKKLDPTLKPSWVWAIAYGSIIGWAAFVLPIDWIAEAGPLGASIGILIGALMMIVIGLSYSYMINLFPVSGGEFVYTFVRFGRVNAFIAGWFLTLAYICIVALNASALALLSKFIFPDFVKVGYLYTIAGYEVYLGQIAIATSALALFAYLNIRGASVSGQLQFFFCLVLIFGILLMSIGTALSSSSSLQNLSPGFLPGQSALISCLRILSIAPFAFMGFDNIPQAAEEFNFDPKKALSLIFLSIFSALITYPALILLISSFEPWQVMLEEIGHKEWTTGILIERHLGPIGLFVITISISMGVLTGLNGFCISASRLLFAMGRAKVLPDSFGNLHEKRHTPYVGILFTMALAALAPWFGREALLWIVDMSALGVAIAYSYCCFAAYCSFSWRDFPGKKGVALIGGLLSIGFMLILLFPLTPASLHYPSLIALAVWIILGTLFYAANWKKYHAISDEEMTYLITGK